MYARLCEMMHFNDLFMTVDEGLEYKPFFARCEHICSLHTLMGKSWKKIFFGGVHKEAAKKKSSFLSGRATKRGGG